MGSRSPGNKSSTGAAARSKSLEFVYDDEHVMDAEEAASLVELRPSSESIDNIVLPEAAALTHPELTLISICAIASESPAVLSSECIIHFVEQPRLLI